MSNIPGLPNGFAGPQPAASTAFAAASLHDIRSKFFSSTNKELRRERINIFGIDLELRQPTLGEAIEMAQNKDMADVNAAVYVLVKFCYIPGTDQNIFTTADVDQITSLPMGNWVGIIGDAFSRVQGTQIVDAEKNSVTNPS